jgi:hypothetical protein
MPRRLFGRQYTNPHLIPLRLFGRQYTNPHLIPRRLLGRQYTRYHHILNHLLLLRNLDQILLLLRANRIRILFIILHIKKEKASLFYETHSHLLP